MKTKFEYIHFVKVADKPKTSVWSCLSNRSDDELGEVEWYGPWRQYCFTPNPEILPIFNASCLEDIAAFIRSLPRKSGKKPAREKARDVCDTCGNPHPTGNELCTGRSDILCCWGGSPCDIGCKETKMVMKIRDMKTDTRPQRGGWASGNYVCRPCIQCDEQFIGDKRAVVCADCAYAEPDEMEEPDTKNRLLNNLKAGVKMIWNGRFYRKR